MQAEDGASPPVMLRCFPPSDGAFQRYAEQALAELAGLAVSSLQGPRILEGALREAYPQAVVRPRTELAALDLRPAPIWYVYRDGKVIADDADSAADERR